MLKKSVLLGTVSAFALFPQFIEPAVAQDGIILDPIVVTSTREGKPKSELTEIIGVLSEEDITFISPVHPADAANRVAGVYVNNLGGEGHMTSIRQPITTGAVYLFLEDGIPTRPVGIFNHNALYEVNIPQAGSLEITKGPSSSLYGSDAIGGVINSITAAPPTDFEFSFNPEFGSFGYKRLLTSVGSPLGLNAGFVTDLNITDNKGWRDNSEYNRIATTTRFDAKINKELKFKSIFAYTQVEQTGISSLGLDDYINNPRKNFFEGNIGRRNVDALRFSTEVSYQPNEDELLTVTPFFRHNVMELLPSFRITFDPSDFRSEFQSYGTNIKYRKKLPKLNAEIITGVDLDYTTHSNVEKQVVASKDGDTFLNAIENGRTNYDYDADMLAVSPYIHGEWQAIPTLRFSAGLRFDYFNVDYTDNLDPSVAEREFYAPFGRPITHNRPDSQTIEFDSLSPKAGVVWNALDNLDIYASYKHAFRAPSVSRLFRSGSSINTDQLKPVNADSFELGFRGVLNGWLNYDITGYHMLVKDDIVSFDDLATRTRTTLNAAETLHQGIEVQLNGQINEEWGFTGAFSISNQEYEKFSVRADRVFDGNKVRRAPETLGNLAIQYRPSFVKGLMIEGEWVHVGDYFVNEANAAKYDGHNLFNLRASLDIGNGFELYGRVENVTDERYSTLTTLGLSSPVDGVQYRPGLPRSAYIGFRSKF